MAPIRSPLAPEKFPGLPPLAGVRLATGACEIRYKARSDVCLIELAPGSAMAGVFTRSLTAAAPVLWCRKALTGRRARAVVINSGNANAFTGSVGAEAVGRTVEATAGLFGCAKREIFVASTGVIGEPLPDERLTGALAALKRELAPGAWQVAAEAIMTTDTFPKGATRQAEIGGQTVTLNGIAKGSGMIAPDMATMLAFVFTDAKIPAKTLQALLEPATEVSFNSVTIDGDTSTNDTLLLAATGQVGHRRVSGPRDPLLKGFRAALTDLLCDLARQLARDGEGAQKLVTIHVTGAASRRAARRIGLAIGNSPLVKTPTGAASSWRWARPARRPSATSWPSASAGSRSPATVWPFRATTKRRSPAT
jgi:glutamate N-acetyltransferase/amino-acid N-acetyltransferase